MLQNSCIAPMEAPMYRKRSRAPLIIFIILLVVLLALGALGYWTARRGFPQADGTLRLPRPRIRPVYSNSGVAPDRGGRARIARPGNTLRARGLRRRRQRLPSLDGPFRTRARVHPPRPDRRGVHS